MKKLADGDVTIDVPGVGRKDELGRMAEAVEHFKEQAIKKLKKKAQEEEDIKRWQQEDAERLGRENEAAHQDQIAIDNLASGLATLADGDLTSRIDGVDGPTSTASKCQGVGAGGATMKETVHERVYQNRRRSGQAVYSDSCAGEQGRARGEAQVAPLEISRIFRRCRALPHRHGGLRLGALLGAPASRDGSRRAADAAGLRQGLCHMWTAPNGKHFLALRTIWSAAVICPACLRGAYIRWP